MCYNYKYLPVTFISSNSLMWYDRWTAKSKVSSSIPTARTDFSNVVCVLEINITAREVRKNVGGINLSPAFRIAVSSGYESKGTESAPVLAHACAL
ncbi:unnamed protein product [Chrysodeixis includens]|uniref:Uncharacterized protein n=1 Tax=Chrysodeixis includens TaxID=689277 RepID=A0A9N8L7M6_CHRIL|nr:unnamed protein product [Chrysodeixis includens]